jgi:hypothetical protein
MAVYDDWDDGQLYDLYVEQGYTRQELADYYGYSASTVSRALRHFDVYKADVLDNEGVEERIRDTLYAGLSDIPLMNEGLMESLPIGYDPESGLWIVNDYVADPRKRNSHDFPAEIHIRYSKRTRRFSVESIEIRNKNYADNQARLETLLNSGD